MNWSWYGKGIGLLLVAVLAALAVAWRRRGKGVYETIGMEQIHSCAVEYLEQHPQAAAITFVLFSRKGLPREVERLGIPGDVKFVILAGIPKADESGMERWVKVLLGRRVDAAVAAELGEKAYTIER